MSDFAHPFDAAIALAAATPNRRLGRTSADYWNMVSPYGGITAAVMMQAMLDHPDRRGTPLAFTINYLAPIDAGDFVIETELVRSNRSSQHWAIRLLQGEPGRVLAQVIAICAVRRETWSHVEATRPEVPPADACAVAPPRNATGFLQRYEFRIVRGKPFAANEDSLSHVWVADNPPRPLDFASLTALCDSFLPRIFLRRPEFVPIGTVSINIYFHAGEEALIRQGAAPLLAVAQAQAFSDGHFDHHGHVWSTDGELLATTQQLVWYKE
ncbi:acyl-CoA thioesterase [Sulfuritalea hydrogenivorans]|uniref:TesB-like acyl-CoA thioesterase 2 n=1 Tax=Sulfuritalea hydrogenivorans sk43H TaxID=1223802 RepID=W0SFT2_9PROT|nr:thioesterase family protein [Sulfuritalea hydrogenivorans]BAO30129.1 TesB-like acyl-CoA thioesterase 2 [Sulfuritalea hydrogenivorans sk43H]